MKKVYAVMYHYVRDLKHSRYPEIKAMDIDQFEKQLEFFSTNFNIITMEEVIKAWNEEEFDLPDRSLLLTFDDGYIDNYTNIYPILKRRHMQGSFFIPGKTITENCVLNVNKIHFILACGEVQQIVKDMFELLDKIRNEGYELPTNEQLYKTFANPYGYDDKDTIFIKRILQTGVEEKIRNRISSILFQKYVGISEEDFACELYMNKDQIRIMKEGGMFIGLHGYDHYWLGNLDEEKMMKDIDSALIVLKDFIEPNCWVINYPFGSYNESVISYIEKKGCKLGMSSKVDVAEKSRYGKFVLPRLDCNAFPPKSVSYKEYI